MKYRKIGSSDLEVSTVALGTWVFGGESWGGTDDADSAGAIEAAIDKGLNLIDTAPVYGWGRSEEVIGRAIKGKREKLILATKCGLEKKDKGIRCNLSASFLRKEIENSLKRLGTEMIDLYQCHWPDNNTSMEETFTELNKFVEEGKVRYIGVSNFDRDQLARAMEYACIVSNQMEYSILNRKIEQRIIPLCEGKNISILAYGPLGGGILTGKYKRPPELKKNDVRSFFYRFYREPVWSKVMGLVNVLENIASKHGVPLSQVAINWVLSKKTAASCITGCRTASQAAENAGAGDWGLRVEEVTAIDEEYKKIFDKG